MQLFSLTNKFLPVQQMTQNAFPYQQASIRQDLHLQCLHEVQTRLRGFTRSCIPASPRTGGLELDLHRLRYLGWHFVDPGSIGLERPV